VRRESPSFRLGVCSSMFARATTPDLCGLAPPWEGNLAIRGRRPLPSDQALPVAAVLAVAVRGQADMPVPSRLGDLRSAE
jgi:hypothetical protein